MFSRRTKIVATLGPAADQPGVLEALVAAGRDCARLNCSHGTREELRRRAAEVRSVAARAGWTGLLGAGRSPAWVAANQISSLLTVRAVSPVLPVLRTIPIGDLDQRSL